MSHTKIAPIDVVSGARAVETLLKKKDGFSFKASTKTREPFCFTRIYDNLAIKIMAILPVMHDEHGILHVTGNKILLCVRKTIPPARIFRAGGFICVIPWMLLTKYCLSAIKMCCPLIIV